MEIFKNKEEQNKIVDRVIEIVLIIIIILLLLHNCELIKKRDNSQKNDGKVNIIDITCNSNKCQKPENVMVDCLEDEGDGRCLVPNFVGKTKKDVLRWLSSISNTLEVEIKTVENAEYKDGTVLEQSVSNTKVKDLINGKVRLVITIVNNGSLVDCQKNSKNSKCSLPNFVGKTKNDVVDWADGITNNVKIKYVYVDSNKKAGTIVSQSVKSGTSVKDILDNDETVIIYISNGGKKTPSDNQGGNTNPDEPTPDDPTPDEPTYDDDFYVSDNKIAKWQDETNLNIFEDSIYKVPGKIAPESTNTYKFIVNNGTSYTLKYKISFSETNRDNINIKYKLKKGNTYIVDHFVSFEELGIDNMILNTESSDTYYLEWKWIGDNDSNDTQIGRKARTTNVSYGLKINVEAESI